MVEKEKGRRENVQERRRGGKQPEAQKENSVDGCLASAAGSRCLTTSPAAPVWGGHTRSEDGAEPTQPLPAAGHPGFCVRSSRRSLGRLATAVFPPCAFTSSSQFLSESCLFVRTRGHWVSTHLPGLTVMRSPHGALLTELRGPGAFWAHTVQLTATCWIMRQRKGSVGERNC